MAWPWRRRRWCSSSTRCIAVLLLLLLLHLVRFSWSMPYISLSQLRVAFRLFHTLAHPPLRVRRSLLRPSSSSPSTALPFFIVRQRPSLLHSLSQYLSKLSQFCWLDQKEQQPKRQEMLRVPRRKLQKYEFRPCAELLPVSGSDSLLRLRSASVRTYNIFYFKGKIKLLRPFRSNLEAAGKSCAGEGEQITPYLPLPIISNAADAATRLPLSLSLSHFLAVKVIKKVTFWCDGGEATDCIGPHFRYKRRKKETFPAASLC